MQNSLAGNKNFVLLVGGQVASLMATLILRYSFALYLLEMTQSEVLFASIIAIAYIPSVVLTPTSGVFSDWFNKKYLMVIYDVCSGLLGFIGIYMVLQGQMDVLSVTVILLLYSVISGMYTPLVSSSIPLLVEEEQIVKANSVNTLATTFGNLFSPLIVGIIYGFFGLEFILIIVTCIFFIAAFFECFIVMDKPEEHKKTWKQFFIDFKSGLDFLKNENLVLVIAIVSLLVNLIIMPLYTIGIPYITKEVLHFTDIQFGISEASIILGLIVGAVLANSFEKHSLRKFIIAALFLAGISVAGKGLTIFSAGYIEQTIYVLLLLCGVLLGIGAIFGILNVNLNAVIQKMTPRHLLGRVNSVVIALVTAVIPLGQFLIGFMFEQFAAYTVVMIYAGILMMISLLFFLYFKWKPMSG